MLAQNCKDFSKENTMYNQVQNTWRTMYILPDTKYVELCTTSAKFVEQ